MKGEPWIQNRSLFWQNIFFLKFQTMPKKVGDGRLGSTSIVHYVDVERSSMDKDENVSGIPLKVYDEKDAMEETKKFHCFATFHLFDGKEMPLGAVCKCCCRGFLVPSSRCSPSVKLLPFHLVWGAHKHRCSQPHVALESRKQCHVLVLLSYSARNSRFLFFVKKMGRIRFMEWAGQGIIKGIGLGKDGIYIWNGSWSLGVGWVKIWYKEKRGGLKTN